MSPLHAARRAVTAPVCPLSCFWSALCLLALAGSAGAQLPAQEPPAPAREPTPSSEAGVSDRAPSSAPRNETGELHVVVFQHSRHGSHAGMEISVPGEAPQQTNREGAIRVHLPEGKQCITLRVPDASGGGRPLQMCEIHIVAGESTDLLITLDSTGNQIVSVDQMAPGEAAKARDAARKFEEEMASKPRGTVQGKVVSIDTKEPVDGARLFVRGLPVEGQTDANGNYSLGLPEGSYEISVIHSKFATISEENVQVVGKQTTEVDLELTPSSAELADFVIVAPYIQGGVASLMTERRNSSSVTDALGSEDLAQSPDGSASSATRRIVGASIVGGAFLFVRGLGGRYSNVRLNGVPLPSTDPDLPGFQLDLFPSSLLSSLTVAKTFAPNIPGNFAGGSMNVETRGFPEKLKVSASVGLTYNTAATFESIPSYEGGGYDYLGMDDGTRAVPEGLPSNVNDDRAAAAQAFGNRWEFRRERALPNLSVGLNIGDTLDFDGQKLGYLATVGYRQRATHYTEDIASVSFAEGEYITRNDLDQEVGVDTTQIGALGALAYKPNEQHSIETVAMLTQTADDAANRIAGFSDNEGRNIRRDGNTYVERQLLFNQLLGKHEKLGDWLNINWQLNTAGTMRKQPDTRSTLYREGRGELGFLAAAGSGERLFTELDQRDYGGGLDIDVLLGKEGHLRTGYLGRTAQREFVARRFGSSLLLADPNRPPEVLFAEETAGVEWEIRESTGPTDGFRAGEDLHAAYAMVELPVFDWLRVMAGARYESFRQEIEAYSPFDTTNPLTDSFDREERTDADILPAASLTLRLSDTMNLRAAYGGTVARPLVREMSPFVTPDFVRRRNIQGNPELKRTFIQNYDLRWEMFPSPTEVLALSVFYKTFASPIESTMLDVNGNLFFQNIEGAENFGAEAEVRLGLGALAPELVSFNAGGNIAVIRSEVQLNEDQLGTATNARRPLAGQSPYVVNVSLGYEPEGGPLSAFVFYNVFGRRISDVGGNNLPDSYEEPFHSLDITSFYDLSKTLSLSLSASNLLGQERRETRAGLNFARSFRGRSASLKLTWSP